MAPYEITKTSATYVAQFGVTGITNASSFPSGMCRVQKIHAPNQRATNFVEAVEVYIPKELSLIDKHHQSRTKTHPKQNKIAKLLTFDLKPNKNPVEKEGLTHNCCALLAPDLHLLVLSFRWKVRHETTS